MKNVNLLSQWLMNGKIRKKPQKFDMPITKHAPDDYITTGAWSDFYLRKVMSTE